MTDALRIPIGDARCPWCGSEVGEWSVGSWAACLASGWATRTAVGPTACPVDWRGGRVDHPRPKIETASVCPPIPDRRFDWQATYEDYDGAEDSATRGHVGHGPTEQAAIADLTENFPRPITEWPSAGLYLVLDDPRDVVAWQMRRSLDIAEMQGEQGRDVITQLQVGIIIARAEAARLLQRGDESNMAALSAQASAASHLATLGVVTTASEYRHRIATVLGAVQSVVVSALAAWWPTDPSALAATVRVVGGCVAMVVGGWPAVRRTWTTDSKEQL